MMEFIDPKVFWLLGATLSGNLSDQVSETSRLRRFRKIFGISAVTCSQVWKLCVPELPQGAGPLHLLWTLYFLKQYGVEEVNSAFAQCDEKTFRKWCWIMIQALAELELVRKSACYYCSFTMSFLTTCFFYFIFILTFIFIFSLFALLLYYATDPLGEQVHSGQWQPVPCLSGWD